MVRCLWSDFEPTTGQPEGLFLDDLAQKTDFSGSSADEEKPDVHQWFRKSLMSRHYVFLRPDEIFGIERIVSAWDDSASAGIRANFSFSYRVSFEVDAVF